MIARKIVVIGDFGVGKTSLVRRYVLDEFSDSYRATLGVHLYKREDVIEREGERVGVRSVVWDLEGATVPEPQLLRYLTGAAGAVIVGDLTRDDCEAPMRAYGELFETRMPGRPIIFALNKRDLTSEMRTDVASRLEQRFGSPVMRSSARTGDGAETLFRTVLATILQRKL